jgi:(1->4)-alpha-D-glucan 1-alpha-D-glucosylmutase
VDYARRKDMLATRKAPIQLVADWQSGQIKQAIISRALELRGHLPGLFGSGSYQPLSIEGPAAENLVAFAREIGTDAVITVATIRSAGLLGAHPLPVVPATAWGETRILLPKTWGDHKAFGVLDDTVAPITGDYLTASAVLAHLPVAIIRREAR